MFVTEAELQIVRTILRRHLPGDVRAMVYGSRSTGRNLKPFSDLDLCLRGAAAVDTEAMAGLRRDFADSDLPYRVDVADWMQLAPDFRAAISGDLAPLAVYTVREAAR